MNFIKNPFTVTVFALLLLVAVPHVIPGEDLEFDLDATVSSVYVPPGSAYNFLGILFCELGINGGAELGNLDQELRDRKRSPDTDDEKRVSSPGDADYFPEFVEKQISIRDALTKYCKVSKQLEWRLENRVVNVRSVDLKSRRKNPLDIVLKNIEFKQGSPLKDCRAEIVAQIRKPAKDMGVFVYSRLPADPFILPDSLCVMSNTCLRTGKKYTDTKVRDILNDLVKPFYNVVWVSALSGKETDKECYMSFYFGSWRKKGVEGAERCVERLIKAIRHSSLNQVFEGPLAIGTKRECLLLLYAKYRSEPADVLKALNKAAESEDNKDVRDDLEEIREYLKKSFHEYAHDIIGVEY